MTQRKREPNPFKDHIGNNADVEALIATHQCIRPLTAVEKRMLAEQEEKKRAAAKKRAKKWRGSKPSETSPPPSPTPSAQTP